MQQYLNLLKEIKEKGTYKSPAREGMPGTLSLFGAQMRFNLQEGFPILTTKKVSFKNIVTELLWFMKGDTNIKYLVDNGCNIWNEDAYNYYVKKLTEVAMGTPAPWAFNAFIERIKLGAYELTPDLTSLKNSGYKYGDCGKQYGWLWRHWEDAWKPRENYTQVVRVDQLSELIKGLKTNPMSRRHIITAWNPATLDDMALNACHAMVQFNCRPLDTVMDSMSEPQYYLDCQLYQRSADVFLG